MASHKNTYAAIDLGSNSFHMVVAQPDGDNIRFIDSLRQTVRLGSGLDDKKRLTAETELRALEAIGQFSERLTNVPVQNIRMVGTNTLRRARDTKHFMSTTRKLIGKPIEIISGREEARLIYSAVAHTLPDSAQKRLVVDIGGGSTECIIGKGSKAKLMESINIGSVSSTTKHLERHSNVHKAFKKASLAARLELQPIQKAYKNLGWDEAIGCSGTIKATSRLLAELKITDGTITRGGLRLLIKELTSAKDISDLTLQSISDRRAQVILGGVAVLHGLFKTFELETMIVSEVALREGLIYDMIGKNEHTDTQSETVNNLIERYSIAVNQIARVRTTAKLLFNKAEKVWELDTEFDRALLDRAATLHEIGMGVAHTQYHKHGAYILDNADLLGFSKAEQHAIALMVRYHRRKIDLEDFNSLPEKERDTLLKLTSLLRLAVLLHRGRHDQDITDLKISVKSNAVIITADPQWMEDHPLTAAELQDESERMPGVELRVSAT